MRRLTRIQLASLLAFLLVLQAHAYRVALKDGAVIEFQEYRVEGDRLYYMAHDAEEASVPLEDIDLAKTRLLNPSGSPPLELPGLEAPAKPLNGQRGLSLGEIARKLRKKEPLERTRVLTNDDVADPSSTSAISVIGRITGPPDSDSLEDEVSRFRSLLVRSEGLSSTQLARNELGALDVRFPGRKSWEESLFRRWNTMLNSFRTLMEKWKEYEHVRRVLRSATMLTKGDEMKLPRAQAAVEKALSEARRAAYEYNRLVDYGRARAADWVAR